MSNCLNKGILKILKIKLEGIQTKHKYWLFYYSLGVGVGVGVGAVTNGRDI